MFRIVITVHTDNRQFAEEVAQTIRNLFAPFDVAVIVEVEDE